MLSLGAAAFTSEGTLTDTFSANLEVLPEARGPEDHAVVDEAARGVGGVFAHRPEIRSRPCAASTPGSSSTQGHWEHRSWPRTTRCGSKWYLHRFVGDDPFRRRAIDMRRLGLRPSSGLRLLVRKKTNPKPEKIRHQSTHGTLPASNPTCAIDAGDVITPGVMAQVSSMCRRCEIRKREGVVQRLTAKPRSRLMRATWARSRIVNVRPKRASISSRHCSSIDGGRATTIRSTRRRSSSSRAISPASIVLPRPKRGGPPDATPSTAGHLASTYRSDSQARPDARDAGLTWPLP